MAKKKSAANDTGDGPPPSQTVEPVAIESSARVGTPYVVLARKYRPTTFDDLIGQGAMVTTLQNAFAADRIAQGFMLTGVRGVGKTTTARILSRALNYEREGVDKPTFDMPELGRHCVEIMEGRHPDVLEMDAASNTGVDNIREIIESARYRPLVARHKVFLIDEVHMLSKGAFNALLKTLEEPPEHVKFIFATTEVRKVPVTVLSRTQRFDLRRVDVPALIAHFQRIVAKEGAEAEDEALALIARAAGGSVRDGLSLLDQAIAMGSGRIEASQVRAMLGLADRGRIYDLLETLFGGAAGDALQQFAGLYGDGADPQQVLADLADAVHVVTRSKALGAEAAGEVLPAEEKRRAAALGSRLSMALLSRAWQLLIKGLEESANAPNTAAAAEMVLIRLAYTADLPPPDEIIKTLGGASVGLRSSAKSAAVPAPALPSRAPVDAFDIGPSDPVDDEDFSEDAPPPADPELALPVVLSFSDVVELVGQKREAKLKVHLEEHVSLVKFDPAGSIELHLLDGAPKELANELREKLNAWTGKRWMIALSKAPGAPTLGQVQRERAAAELQQVQRDPAVAAVLQHFPDAEITVRPVPRAKKDDTGTG